MSMMDTYWLGCEDDLEYNNACCFNKEFGRVRSAALIHKSYLPQIIAAPETLSVWNTGINTGKVIIIPQVSGSFDPGEPQKLKGYGTRFETNGPREMKLTFNDPFYQENYFFYNELNKVVGWSPAFRTSSLLHICTTPAIIKTKNVVEDDLESEVIWQAECKMRSLDLPMMVDASGLLSLFTCVPGGIDTVPNLLTVPGGDLILTLPDGKRLAVVQ